MEKTKENIKSTKVSEILSPFKNFIFGKQNERLEYLTDLFFKLSPEKQAVTVVLTVIIFIVTGILTIYIYISSLNGVQKKLDNAFYSRNQLKDVQIPYRQSKQKIIEVAQRIEINKSITIASLLESKAKTIGIKIENITQPTYIPLLSQYKALGDFQMMTIQFSISKTSLAKIITFLTTIEALPNMFKVSSLNITRGFTEKSNLDAEIRLETVVPQNSN